MTSYSCSTILISYKRDEISRISRLVPRSDVGETRNLTTFTGLDGRRWRFTRCPFGLSNSHLALNLGLGNLFSDKTRFHSLACYAHDLLIFWLIGVAICSTLTWLFLQTDDRRDDQNRRLSHCKCAQSVINGTNNGI